MGHIEDPLDLSYPIKFIELYLFDYKMNPKESKCAFNGSNNGFTRIVFFTDAIAHLRFSCTVLRKGLLTCFRPLDQTIDMDQLIKKHLLYDNHVY